MKRFIAMPFVLAFFFCHTVCFADEVNMKISKRYLNFPVSSTSSEKKMTLESEGIPPYSFEIALADDSCDYWVFCDVDRYRGKTIKMTYDGDGRMDRIFQSDEIVGLDSLYKEIYRPQFHFTSKRGWLNDPNGLIWKDGEYHLFYQHNPFGVNSNNKHWGHAVSTDLLHWHELPPALYPDDLGMMYSGTAVIDTDNTAGFSYDERTPMIAIYTADLNREEVQCIASSLDNGRTWAKFTDNPVLDNRHLWKDGSRLRDPKVFWFEKTKKWIMVLFEKDGMSFYKSDNLKVWERTSHLPGFWECPDLFELPVDGDEENTMWVLYGASGTYLIGNFDGEKFIPASGKFRFEDGTIYAGQTFNNIPSADGRTIQIAWMKIPHPGMPFNGMMSVPVELELKTTFNGIRLFSKPISELESLETSVYHGCNLTAAQAIEALDPYADEGALRVRMKVGMPYAHYIGLRLNGQDLVLYDMNHNKFNQVSYMPDPLNPQELQIDLLLDRTSVEIFVDEGAFAFYGPRLPEPGNQQGFQLINAQELDIRELSISKISSIW